MHYCRSKLINVLLLHFINCSFNNHTSIDSIPDIIHPSMKYAFTKLSALALVAVTSIVSAHELQPRLRGDIASVSSVLFYLLQSSRSIKLSRAVVAWIACLKKSRHTPPTSPEPINICRYPQSRRGNSRNGGSLLDTR